jgi:hypothetical protein
MFRRLYSRTSFCSNAHEEAYLLETKRLVLSRLMESGEIPNGDRPHQVFVPSILDPALDAAKVTKTCSIDLADLPVLS